MYMTVSLVAPLLGIGLSAVALIATPLAARVTHRMPDPESGYFSTTVMALLITAAFGGGGISTVVWIAEFGKTATWILVPAYIVFMVVAGRIAWRLFGPQDPSRVRMPGGHPLGA
jgi:hypothetical protein